MIVTTTDVPTKTSWWADPSGFDTRLADFNRERKTLGDSDLPTSVARYLTQQETCQAREMAELPARPAPPQTW